MVKYNASGEFNEDRVMNYKMLITNAFAEEKILKLKDCVEKCYRTLESAKKSLLKMDHDEKYMSRTALIMLLEDRCLDMKFEITILERRLEKYYSDLKKYRGDKDG